MIGFCLKLLLQIVFQTMFLFLILWSSLFDNRWENVRSFLTRNYSPESVIYLSGLLIFFALIVTTIGWGFYRYKLLLNTFVCKIKAWNEPQKVQNFLLCVILNLKILKLSRNIIRYTSDICKKVSKVSEFNFTLLPSSEILCLENSNYGESLFAIILSLNAFLLSSIPERPWKFICYRLSYIHNCRYINNQ